MVGKCRATNLDAGRQVRQSLKLRQGWNGVLIWHDCFQLLVKLVVDGLAGKDCEQGHGQRGRGGVGSCKDVCNSVCDQEILRQGSAELFRRILFRLE